eukprot:TRINITY_DN42217_c0_g1_i1.p1 TRINITY_DN42217_c0_g1~~TRINITY_DN42217_c0_g1_i1.p1  ORF type:complete len:914 (-),score=131.68 TRINITY_DN42217_c0_g1_i1:73-2814(-)
MQAATIVGTARMSGRFARRTQLSARGAADPPSSADAESVSSGAGGGSSVVPLPPLASAQSAESEAGGGRGRPALLTASRSSAGVGVADASRQSTPLERSSPENPLLPSLPPRHALEAQAAEPYPLLEMASLGRGHALEALVQSGADRTKADAFGRTALHLAASFGREAAVKAVIRLGLRLDIRDHTGAMPLHLAAQNGHTPVITALVEARADVDCLCARGRTPLHYAVEGMEAEACRHLVHLRSETEARAEGNPTPLLLAVLTGHTLVLNALIDVRCDMHAMDEEGATPLHVAACKQRLEVMEVLVRRGCRTESSDVNGLLPIHRGARAGEHEAVGWLVELQANPSARTTIGRQTALHLAAMSDELDCIDTLARVKTNLEAQDTRGYTAIHTAVEYDRLRALERLLQLGVPRDLQTKAADTAMHMATHGNAVHLVQCLLAYFANVNSRGRGGRTALHAAAEVNNMELSTTLLEAGSRGSLATVSTSPAATSHREGSAGGSRKSAASRGTGGSSDGTDVRAAANQAAAGGGNGSDVGTMPPSHMANPNVRDEKRQTPLHVAAWHGRAKLCQYLIQARAEVDAIDADGNTALSLSVRKDHDATLKMLLRLFADPMRQDPQGLGPLQQACICGSISVSRTLAEMRMLPRLDETPWRRPMALAKFYGHQKIVDYFFKPCPRNRLILHMPRAKGNTLSVTFMAISCEPPLTSVKLQAVQVVVPNDDGETVHVGTPTHQPSLADIEVDSHASVGDHGFDNTQASTVAKDESPLLALSTATVVQSSTATTPSSPMLPVLKPLSATPSSAMSPRRRQGRSSPRTPKTQWRASAEELLSTADSSNTLDINQDITEEQWKTGYTVVVGGLKKNARFLLRLVAVNDAGVSHGDPIEVQMSPDLKSDPSRRSRDSASDREGGEST